MRSFMRSSMFLIFLVPAALSQAGTHPRAEPQALGTGVSPGLHQVFFQDAGPISKATNFAANVLKPAWSQDVYWAYSGSTALHHFFHNPEGYLTTALQRTRSSHPEVSFTALEAQLNRQDSFLYAAYREWAEIPPSLGREWTRQQVFFLRAVNDFLQTARLSPEQLRENILFLSHFNQAMSVLQSHAVLQWGNNEQGHSPGERFYLPAVLLSGRHRGLLGAWMDLLAEGALTLDETVMHSTPPPWLKRSFENAS